ncbi:MAG: rhodanese-like domain-containing protein [Gammaproteobacteria bacterium]
MTTFRALIEACRAHVEELYPWDLTDALEAKRPLLLLDVREPYEFNALAIRGSINVPRGILEPSCEYGFEETLPELVEARERSIVVICRSGNRSLLAAQVMQQLGYRDVRSLATGLKGWNDYDQPLWNSRGERVDPDTAEAILSPPLRPAQLGPQGKA